ncbi:MAG: endolytic transglycosylase MltG [Candidatus Falkowbacteria bacterium]|nr:endolytic transglycosylase MltG [Candidatus Falkowbacteria bacterium]
MKKIFKFAIILLIAVIIISVWWYNFKLSARSSNNQAVSFIVESGSSKSNIADQLFKEKIINSSLAFKIHFYFNSDKSIQAGEYIFEKNSKIKDVITQLENGVVSDKEFSVLIREGLNAKEINEYLKTKGYLKDDSFLTLAQMPVKNLPKDLTNFSFIGLIPQNNDLEGYLFPDTYRLYKDFTASDLIKKMLANFDNKVDSKMRDSISSSGKSLNDIVIMASILEKEVRSEQDMKIASGIFWDRIKIGQALQSCATLGYVLGVNKAQYTYEDTQIKSTYNTYKNPGLTPGPISNPGLKSIGAAILPIKTDYNYFLSRPDTGETVFSKTLDEHNAAKAKYLK